MAKAEDPTVDPRIPSNGDEAANIVSALCAKRPHGEESASESGKRQRIFSHGDDNSSVVPVNFRDDDEDEDDNDASESEAASPPMSFAATPEPESAASKPRPVGSILLANLVVTLPHHEPAKATALTLPNEIVQRILSHCDKTTINCLALTSKYFAACARTTNARFPPLGRKYQLDTRRIEFMKLIKGNMPADFRLCWICRKYKPINGGQLEKYPNGDCVLTAIKDPVWYPSRKLNVKTYAPWTDSDWTTLTLGACRSKTWQQDVRTYCPHCTTRVNTINFR